MKKTSICTTVTFILFAAEATAQKGSWYIGGQMGYSSKTEKNTGYADIKTNTWNVAPEIGTFLQNNLQLGFAVNLGGEKIENSTEIKTTEFSPVIYLRRFFKVADQFSTFVGIIGTVTTGSTEIDGTKYDLGGGGANLSLGAAYALSKRFTAVGHYGLFGYTTQTTKNDSFKNTVNNVGLNVNSLGPVFNVGLYWTFSQ